GGYAVNQSGASLAALPSPFRPAFVGADVSSSSSIMVIVNNLDSEGIKLQPSPDSTRVMFPLFAFGANSSAGATWGSAEPARFYAGTGDIVGLRTGEMLAFTSAGRPGQTWYESAGPVWMMAGRDIVNA